MQKQIREFDNLLFIGDPHLTLRGPGSRVDDFGKTSLWKLRQSLELARQHRAWAIITGDLFLRNIEAQALLDELCDLLWEYQDVLPSSIVGNHDKKELVELTKGMSLQLIFATRLLTRLTQVGIPVKVAGQLFNAMGVGHGEELPAACPERTILVTHHDLAFPGCEYPGTSKIPNIPGVVIGVNGHIHKHCEKPLQVGDALWFNPGNIVRVSRGERENVPGVLLWHPEEGARRIELQFAPSTEVFAAKPGQRDVQGTPGEDAAEQEDSLFAKLVAVEGELSAKQTSDGTFLKGVIDNVLDAAEATSEARLAMARLMQRAVETIEAEAQ